MCKRGTCAGDGPLLLLPPLDLREQPAAPPLKLGVLELPPVGLAHRPAAAPVPSAAGSGGRASDSDETCRVPSRQPQSAKDERQKMRLHADWKPRGEGGVGMNWVSRKVEWMGGRQKQKDGGKRTCVCYSLVFESNITGLSRRRFQGMSEVKALRRSTCCRRNLQCKKFGALSAPLRRISSWL